MQINQPSPDAAETAMLVMLSRDAVNNAEHTGHSTIKFHGYIIECNRLPYQCLIQIKCAGQLISKQNAWLNS
jgi:hypothetical protein